MNTVDNLIHTANIYSYYVPFVNTAVSLINLFEKYALFPVLESCGAPISESHHVQTVQNTNFVAFVVLAIPIIGNIVYYRGQEEEEVSEEITTTNTPPSTTPQNTTEISNLHDVFTQLRMQAQKNFFSKNADKEILTFIENIINNEEFRKAPLQYMQDSADRRGATEEYRIPDDPACSFLTTRLSPLMDKLYASAREDLLKMPREGNQELTDKLLEHFNHPDFQLNPIQYTEDLPSEEPSKKVVKAIFETIINKYFRV